MEPRTSGRLIEVIANLRQPDGKGWLQIARQIDRSLSTGEWRHEAASQQQWLRLLGNKIDYTPHTLRRMTHLVSFADHLASLPKINAAHVDFGQLSFTILERVFQIWQVSPEKGEELALRLVKNALSLREARRIHAEISSEQANLPRQTPRSAGASQRQNVLHRVLSSVATNREICGADNTFASTRMGTFHWVNVDAAVWEFPAQRLPSAWRKQRIALNEAAIRSAVIIAGKGEAANRSTQLQRLAKLLYASTFFELIWVVAVLEHEPAKKANDGETLAAELKQLGLDNIGVITIWSRGGPIRFISKPMRQSDPPRKLLLKHGIDLDRIDLEWPKRLEDYDL